MTEQQSSCLISDIRTCHVTDQKNRVFIIGSGSSEFAEEINSVREVLNELGLNGYFALLSENEKGLDAFCDKICSKIRGSQFCVAMLNDPIISKKIEGKKRSYANVRVPNANVYYEFGMAVAFGKNVIPIVRKGYELPFDVQHLDSIIYASLPELKSKLKKVIVVTLQKTPKKVVAVSTKVIELIYGPLYNEIVRFLSKKNKFSKFNHPHYGSILTNHRYLLDAIDESLRKEIESFFDEVDQFNVLLRDCKNIIDRIIIEQTLDVFGEKVSKDRLISIGLKTDSTTILPTLGQVLLRNTTPELYFETEGIPQIIRKITYELTTEDYKRREIPAGDFKPFFEKCREIVEKNPRIIRLRELQKHLLVKAEDLKAKLGRLCQ